MDDMLGDDEAVSQNGRLNRHPLNRASPPVPKNTYGRSVTVLPEEQARALCHNSQDQSSSGQI